MYFKENIGNCDEVSFYVRKDFSEYVDSSSMVFNLEDFEDENDNEIKNITHFIRRGDNHSLIYYIKAYMDTTVKNKRPDTPAKLITNSLPSGFVPDL